MSKCKGFTLIEIIVVLIIIGILASIAVPSYFNYIQQGASTAAQNNLVTIYNGQKTYYLGNGNGAYYSSGGNANDLGGINTALGLNVTDNNFQYTCSTAGNSYSCTATGISDTTLVLTVTSSSQIILPGATNCPGASCNPSCVDTGGSNCPT